MNRSRTFLALSRPLTLLACMIIFIVDPQVSRPSIAIYVVSAAFFVASSSVLNKWLTTTYQIQFGTAAAELALISFLNWYSLYLYQNNAVMVCYAISIATIPLILERKAWRPGMATLAAAWVLTTLLGLHGTVNWHQTLLVMTVYAGALLFFSSTGVLMRNLEDERAKTQQLLEAVTASRAALERANRQLQASAARQQEMAVLEERHRLAREIHDSVAHGLTALVVQTQAARKLISRDPALAAETAARCEEMAREALQETRRAVRALHPSGLEQQTDVAALERLARDYGIATDMQVTVQATEGARTLPPDPARLEQLYRIFQEALTNAHRHGQARHVTAELDVAEAEVHLTITNDGLPPAHLDPGIGLKSMAERAHSVGGTIAYAPGPVGMTVRVTVPLKQGVAG